MPSSESQTTEVALVPSEWARAMKIPEAIIQETKLFSQMGWALDSANQPRQLTPNEMKLVALACHQSSLSVMGKQIIFLGNSLYVTKNGKVSVARRDSKMPLARVKVRPATQEEREAYGVINNDPMKSDKYEHLWFAEIYARFEGSERAEIVADSFGHACVGNIKLYGKQNDPRRLCADMASTRAMSRALSQVYDFFGIDSYEEIGLAAPRVVVDTEAEVVERHGTPTENLADDLTAKAGTEEPTAKDSDAWEGHLGEAHRKKVPPKVLQILDLIEENKEILAPALVRLHNETYLRENKDEALDDIYDGIVKKIEEAKEKEAGQSELGLSEAERSGPGEETAGAQSASQSVS